MVKAHHLGFPRIGVNRDLKWAVERYWKHEINQQALIEEGQRIKNDNWVKQIEAGHDFISVGDFSWYDHVLDTSTLLGVFPERFLKDRHAYDLDTYFRMARGRAPTGADTHASEMTKWFDTNYHYIVPEFQANQTFSITNETLFADIAEAQLHHVPVKPVLLGPLSYLWLGKGKDENFDKLSLLKNLQQTYIKILTRILAAGVEWVQIDEPILVLDLPEKWQNAFRETYELLNIPSLKLMLTTYFENLDQQLELACQLPTAGLHIDVVRGDNQLNQVLKELPTDKVLSVGIVDGRNIWRTDLRKALITLQPIKDQLQDRLWVGSSCSLLHSPVDLNAETELNPEIKNWLAFATQKLTEIATLKKALNQGEKSIEKALALSDSAVQSRLNSPLIHNALIKERLNKIVPDMTKRHSQYEKRKLTQATEFGLPIFPTTTIGSFPQTREIRSLRHDYKLGKISEDIYREHICQQIKFAIDKQLELDLDVLVHGEAERNDMVEYFGELLQGFAFTKNGWVQSYGSRCVKPPIIYGDISRPKPMTTEWSSYAQSLTTKPVKGMLTGPITILCWSFVRDDQPRLATAKQIALALRDEVTDLVKAGIRIIQIDEPAFREGLPLKKQAAADYLEQAVFCFRVASCGVPDHVQIHTHMCYSEFNETIAAIAELDADVITIETSRSNMELLKAFENFNYPNDIGPGVYDIHSPRTPTINEILELIEKATQLIPIQQLWINPDCGLKTRDWKDAELALRHMVQAAKLLREKYQVRINAQFA